MNKQNTFILFLFIIILNHIAMATINVVDVKPTNLSPDQKNFCDAVYDNNISLIKTLLKEKDILGGNFDALLCLNTQESEEKSIETAKLLLNNGFKFNNLDKIDDIYKFFVNIMASQEANLFKLLMPDSLGIESKQQIFFLIRHLRKKFNYEPSLDPRKPSAKEIDSAISEAYNKFFPGNSRNLYLGHYMEHWTNEEWEKGKLKKEN